VTYDHSHRITEMINRGDLSEKPGWVRLSVHPTMTGAELETVIVALREITTNAAEWSTDYIYNRRTNEFTHRDETVTGREKVRSWFNLQD
jgi:hypothetical protein